MSYNIEPYKEQGTGKIKGAIETQAASEAATVSALKDDFNALLTKLKNSGLMKSE